MGKLFLPAAFLFLSGCVHYLPSTVSTTSINRDFEEPVAITSGESSAYYLFGFMGPLGNDSLEAAIEDAQGTAPCDTMVNVFVDRQVLNFPFDFFPIFTRIKTNVFGTLIKYKAGAIVSQNKKTISRSSLFDELKNLDIASQIVVHTADRVEIGFPRKLHDGALYVSKGKLDDARFWKKILLSEINRVQSLEKVRYSIEVE